MRSPAKANEFRAGAKSFRSRRELELLAGPNSRRSISARKRPTHLTPGQRERAKQRRAWLRAAEPLLTAGLSQTAVAAAIGVSGPTLSRLLNSAPHSRVEQIGNFNAVEKCKRLLAAGRADLAPGVAEGRVSEFVDLLAVPDITNELNRLYAGTIRDSCAQATGGRRPGSIGLALKRLGEFPIVPPRLAAKLQVGCKPKPFVEYIKRSYPLKTAAKLRKYWRQSDALTMMIFHSPQRPDVMLKKLRLHQ